MTDNITFTIEVVGKKQTVLEYLEDKIICE